MPATAMKSEFLSVYDVATRMGCSCQSVRRLIARGVLQGIPLPGGRKIWIRRAQVDAVMEKLHRTASAEREKSRKNREVLFQMWLDI